LTGAQASSLAFRGSLRARQGKRDACAPVFHRQTDWWQKFLSGRLFVSLATAARGAAQRPWGRPPPALPSCGTSTFYSWRSAWLFQFPTNVFVPQRNKDYAATTVAYRSGSRIPAVSQHDTNSQRGKPNSCNARLNILRRAQTVAAITATT